MQARIEQTTMGYKVKLSPCADFTAMLELFKSIIPKKCRVFIEDHKYWFVDLRARRKIERFVDAVTNAGGKVKR